jgi:predicted ATP-grasp superfamily ATP-dependent carboligase
VIAPEFDGILEERCRLISACGGRTAGSSADAIALCADKLRLAEHLKANGVATIRAEPWKVDDAVLALKQEPSFPLVVKPQFGAGSLHSFLLTSVEDLQKTEAELTACGMELIAQAFIAGQPLSVAAIVSRNGIEMFPLCTQNIIGKRLEYAGGTVPAIIERADAVVELAKCAIASVEGLHGYVGVDLILPSDGPPLVVEINPRLTSSYHGYRRLAKTNLAPRVLQPDAEARPLAWHKTPISFLADGTAFAEDEVSKSPS